MSLDACLECLTGCCVWSLSSVGVVSTDMMWSWRLRGCKRQCQLNYLTDLSQIVRVFGRLQMVIMAFEYSSSLLIYRCVCSIIKLRLWMQHTRIITNTKHLFYFMHFFNFSKCKIIIICRNDNNNRRIHNVHQQFLSPNSFALKYNVWVNIYIRVMCLVWNVMRHVIFEFWTWR